ncbi:MAG TPA: MgtC/SapB family protein [Candidatus Polarisedimenticolia bacterium]|nr:MgtC/SapB family protein [Candidatus Polarisedimenticolia bacterium]
MPESWDLTSPMVIDFVVKALLAIVCGGLIGVEREIKDKPAGFRTNILICLGSMLFMWLSTKVAMVIAADRPSDPGRIAAQVVTGIGFLGAGTIIQSRGRIIGLTSAAMIWVVSAVGMTIGAGYGIIALITTGIILVVLVGLGLVERRVFSRCTYHDCQIAFDDDNGRTRREIEVALRSLGRPLESFHLRRADDHVVLTVPYCDAHREHKKILGELWKIEGVREVRPLR